MTTSSPQGSNAPVRMSVFSRDLDEAQSLISTAHAPVRVVSDVRGSFDMKTDAVSFDGICFSRTVSASGLECFFDLPFDGYGLTLPESGYLEVGAGSNDRLQSTRDSGLMVDSQSVTRAKFLRDSSMQRITVTTNAMHDRLRALTGLRVHQRIRFDPNVPVRSGAGRTATAIAQAFRVGMEGTAPLLQSPAALTSLREAVVNLILEVMPHNHSLEMNRGTRSPRHVRRAIEFMHAYAASPLRLEDLAAATGVSGRCLQVSFRQFCRMTPMRYLRKVRLNGARAELLLGQPGTTVGQVAYRWGFAHAGLFSTNYAREFGETPSATLRRGLPRP